MYKAAFLPPKGARELGSSRGSSRSTNSSILAAVNNPRLPPGGWEISEKRTCSPTVISQGLPWIALPLGFSVASTRSQVLRSNVQNGIAVADLSDCMTNLNRVSGFLRISV